MYSVAILAGGLATRFGGGDKSALLVDGRTILERQLAALTALSGDVLIVGHSGGGSEAPARPGVRRVNDVVPGCGPLGGVHAALTAAEGDEVLVVACDMPYVTGALGAFLLGLAGQADLVVPKTERGYHPLCAVYTRACLAAVTRRLEERRLRLQDLRSDVRTREVTAKELRRFGDDGRLLANVNTPGELAGLEAIPVQRA